MKTVLLVATHRGLVICTRQEDRWQETARGLSGRQVTSVIAREGVILAGTKEGVFRSGDAGATWQEANDGLAVRHIRWLANHPDISDYEFAGVEPAGIFISQDGASTWRPCPEVFQLRDRYRWYLPYSPRAGCVRGFAFHGERAYAAVEVGGVLVSMDRGEHWQLAAGSSGNPSLGAALPEGFIHPDVHSINVHPSSADLAAAPTGGGFYYTADGGKTWTLLYDCYCRAVWLDPADPAHMILGPADNVDRNGRIEETRDAGRTWTSASQGLSLPWRDHMVERFTRAGDELIAVLSNGDLLAADLGAAALHWQPVLTEVPGAAAVASMEI